MKTFPLDTILHEYNFVPLGGPAYWDWNQHRVRGEYWRLYWNDAPGAFIRPEGGAKTELLPDRLILLPPGLVYASRCTAEVHHFFLHFTMPEPYREAEQRPFPATDPETVAAAARLAHSFPGTDNLRRYAARLNLLIWSALLEVPDQALPPLRQYDPRIVRAMERLRTDPDADNSRLARDAGLSRNSFLRLFRAEVGTPPQQFARRERLLQAARQLHFSESSIEEIAQQAGFCDRYHFSRAFHKEFNCGPATYRKLAIRRHDGSRR